MGLTYTVPAPATILGDPMVTGALAIAFGLMLAAVGVGYALGMIKLK